MNPTRHDFSELSLCKAMVLRRTIVPPSLPLSLFMCVCACACKMQSMSEIILAWFSPLFTAAWSLKLGPLDMDSLPGQLALQIPPCLCLLRLELQKSFHAHPAFTWVLGNLSSPPHACKACAFSIAQNTES